MLIMFTKLRVKEDPYSSKIEGDEDTIMGLPVKEN